jgi:hypothetical protein
VGHAFHREADPAGDPSILGEELEQRLVDDSDVLRVAGQRDPPTRPSSDAEVRANEERHVPGNLDRALEPRAHRLLADRVSVLEDHRAAFSEREHRFHMGADRAQRLELSALRIAFTEGRGLLDGETGRHVPVPRIVRRGLVGHDVGSETGREERRQEVGGIPDQPHRPRPALVQRLLDETQRLGHVGSRMIQIAALESALGVLRIDLADEGDAVEQ